MLSVAIAGASGRMGRTLLETLAQAPDARLVGALERPASPFLGRDAGELIGAPCGVAISDDIERTLANASVLIDFTRPEGTLRHLAACDVLKVQMVIGTTGLSDPDRARMSDVAQRIGIVAAPNMSVGVNLVFKLLDTAARVLADGYDIEIVEAHHRHKVDAPSGTALRMGEVVAQALARDLARWRGIRPRGCDRRAQSIDHRLRDGARWRHRGRSHGALRGRWRARGDHAQGVEPRDSCPRRFARCAVAR